MSNGAWGTSNYMDDLVDFVNLSANYPARVKVQLTEKSQFESINQQMIDQLSYYHVARNPNHNKGLYTYFFESEEDATLMKIAIGGDYDFKIFEDNK